MKNTDDTHDLSALQLALSPFFRHSPQVAALSGGGGKTTLMFFLTQYLSRQHKIITTTTTKMFFPAKEQSDIVLVGNYEYHKINIRKNYKNFSHITVASECRAHKLIGYSPAVIGDILKSNLADYILVEADGSCGMPFKAYKAHEPPIPDVTTVQFVLCGAEVFCNSFLTEDTIFRRHLFTSLYPAGLHMSPHFRYEQLCLILSDSTGYLKKSPPDARRVLFINKADLLSEKQISDIKKIFPPLLRHLGCYDELIVASLAKNIVYLHEHLGLSLTAGTVKIEQKFHDEVRLGLA